MYEIRGFFSVNTDRNFTKNHIYLYFPCGGYMLNNDKMVELTSLLIIDMTILTAMNLRLPKWAV